jgi:hypothetical protein
VPLDAVVVDIVEHAHAGLHATVDVELCVVGLRHVLTLEKKHYSIGNGTRFVRTRNLCLKSFLYFSFHFPSFRKFSLTF